MVDCWIKHRLEDTLLTVTIILGIIVSYLPQHHRIVRLKSSHGLSPFYLLMGGLSSFSNVLNAALLQSPFMVCCRRVSVWRCIGNLLGFIQLLSQWFMFFTLFVLFVVYYPEEEKYTDGAKTAEWRMTEAAAMIVIAYMMLIGGSCLWLIVVYNAGDDEVAVVPRRAALLLGTISLLLSICQFIPQLTKTYHLKRAGALSVSAMSMQAPGSFVFCYTLAVSPGTNPSTWMTYFVGGCLQSCLLIMCLYYDRRDHPLVIIDNQSTGVDSPSISTTT